MALFDFNEMWEQSFDTPPPSDSEVRSMRLRHNAVKERRVAAGVSQELLGVVEAMQAYTDSFESTWMESMVQNMATPTVSCAVLQCFSCLLVCCSWCCLLVYVRFRNSCCCLF